MVAYVTNAELRSYVVNGNKVCLEAYNNTQLDDEIEIASELIEWFTGTIFRSVSSTVYFNGNGTHRLLMYPELNAPLISVTSALYVDDQDATLETLVENTDFVVEDYALVKPMRPDLSFITARMSSGQDSTTKWVKGYRNYKVSLTYGRSSVPAVVAKATKLLALEHLKPGITGLIRDDVFLQRWEDYTVQYRDSQRTPTPDPALSLGFSHVERLLSKYKVNPSIFLNIPDIPASMTELIPFSDVNL